MYYASLKVLCIVLYACEIEVAISLQYMILLWGFPLQGPVTFLSGVKAKRLNEVVSSVTGGGSLQLERPTNQRQGEGVQHPWMGNRGELFGHTPGK